MANLKELNIVLNMPPNGVYFPGSVVSGALVIEVDKPKSYNGIQIAWLAKQLFLRVRCRHLSRYLQMKSM